MNCSQTRALLASHRELPFNQEDTFALETHLEECASCHSLYNQYQAIGEGIRSIPSIEPPSDSHQRLMQALAAEHVRFIQRSPSSAISTPTPAFLAPYVHALARRSSQTATLTALSTADTGPLPALQSINRHRRPFYMNQFAVIGLAATFLMVLMLSGLTSLVLLAHDNAPGVGVNTLALQRPSQIESLEYSTTTSYSHIASAAANRQYIYYTAYNDVTADWMLEQFNTSTTISTPMLPTISVNPIFVLGTSPDWLVWLQLNNPTVTTGKHQNENAIVRKWTLNALYLNTTAAGSSSLSEPVTLTSDTFNTATAPSFVQTPIQGTWFTQDDLLVAMVDAKGTSHLWSYALNQQNSGITPARTELAQASAGHVLTSPTATSDSNSIYWSEEWLSDTNVLNSNIWTQQTTDATPPTRGAWAPQTIIQKYLYLPDGMSFRPQIVQNTLFLLSTANTNTSVQSTPITSANATATVQPTVSAASTATASPTAPTVANAASVSGISRIDPTIYQTPLDNAIRGTLLAFSADGSQSLPSPQDVNELVSAPQAGGRFLIWQNSSQAFGMYDVLASKSVNIVPGNIPKSTVFLAVNGDTAAWFVTPNTVPNQDFSSADAPPVTVTFGLFNWPTRAPHP